LSDFLPTKLKLLGYKGLRLLCSTKHKKNYAATFCGKYFKFFKLVQSKYESVMTKDDFFRTSGRVARFFLMQHTKTWKDIPKRAKIYQTTIKCISNVYQMATKYTNWL
jgi:hypothetical protein